MNEAETRAEHIDPALAAAGWGVVEGSRIRCEYPITLGLHSVDGAILSVDAGIEIDADSGSTSARVNPGCHCGSGSPSSVGPSLVFLALRVRGRRRRRRLDGRDLPAG